MLASFKTRFWNWNVQWRVAYFLAYFVSWSFVKILQKFSVWKTKWEVTLLPYHMDGWFLWLQCKLIVGNVICGCKNEAARHTYVRWTDTCAIVFISDTHVFHFLMEITLKATCRWLTVVTETWTRMFFEFFSRAPAMLHKLPYLFLQSTVVSGQPTRWIIITGWEQHSLEFKYHERTNVRTR